jgi:hypothetical protein
VDAQAGLNNGNSSAIVDDTPLEKKEKTSSIVCTSTCTRFVSFTACNITVERHIEPNQQHKLSCTTTRSNHFQLLFTFLTIIFMERRYILHQVSHSNMINGCQKCEHMKGEQSNTLGYWY